MKTKKKSVKRQPKTIETKALMTVTGGMGGVPADVAPEVFGIMPNRPPVIFGIPSHRPVKKHRRHVNGMIAGR